MDKFWFVLCEVYWLTCILPFNTQSYTVYSLTVQKCYTKTALMNAYLLLYSSGIWWSEYINILFLLL